MSPRAVKPKRNTKSISRKKTLKNTKFIFKKKTKKTTKLILKKKKRANYPPEVNAYLNAWLEVNVDHPYPTQREKELMAEVCGLSLAQIDQWFINARRRQWPKMKERAEKLTQMELSYELFCSEEGNRLLQLVHAFDLQRTYFPDQ